MPESLRPSLTNVYLVTAVASFGLLPSALLGKEAPGAIAIFAQYAPTIVVAMWLCRYVRDEASLRIHDAGWLFTLLLPVVVPFYALRREGRRGWRLAVLLIGLTIAPQLLAAVAVAVSGR
jgi:hypothetical protein